MSRKVKEYALILVIIGFLAYLPSLFGGFVWDDEDFVYANTYVQQAQMGKFFTENAIAGRGKSSDYYRPVQFSLYSLIYQLSGPQPWAFHLAGIVLHLMAGVLIYFTFVYFINPFPAFVASLLFLIHPVQTESVSYISGLSDQLYTIFFFSSLLLFLKNEAGKWSGRILLSLLLFVLSMLSKELGIIMPGILLIIVLIRGKEVKKDILLLCVYFALAFLYLLLRMTVLKFMDITLSWQGLPYGEHFTTRLATFFHNFFLFLSLLLFPKTLHMERDFSVPVIPSLISVWTICFFLLNGAVITFLFLRRTEKRYRTALLFYILFVCSLVPYTGIFLLNGIFYEHYLYLPMAFFWAAVISFCAPILQKKIMLVGLCIIVGVFMIRSYARQMDWIDNERFYRQTLSYAPQSIRILNGLAMTLADKNDCPEALKFYKKALAIDPRVPNIYHNMGNCYGKLGQVDMAEKEYLEALKINPDFRYSYISLLELYLGTNQKEKAKLFLRDRILPRYPDSPQMKAIYDQL